MPISTRFFIYGALGAVFLATINIPEPRRALIDLGLALILGLAAGVSHAVTTARGTKKRLE